ncbi:MAG: trigger factor [Bacteroidales bacterium]|nr:trigger factor [Bacteroidales bacterium]
MNITKENIDDLNAVLSLTLEKDDYEERVDTVLQDYKKKARLDGFRPGKVPFGLIKKMYRKPVLVEEVNKLVSESLSKYLIEEKLNILGEPLPHEGDRNPIDWDTDEKFEFKFDLGIAPQIDVSLSNKDKFPFYNIKVDEKLLQKYTESYAQRFGEFVSVDQADEKDMIKADIRQLDADNQLAEEGIQVEDASLSIAMVKDEAIKKQFLKAKKDEKITADLKKAYPNETEIAALLRVDKSMVAGIDGSFELTIKDITRFKQAEVDQELFDKVYGPGNVKSKDEFLAKLSEEAKKGTVQDSEYRFRIDVKEILIKKVKFNLPEEFLKRWLYAINEGKYTLEQINNDFESFLEDLKWQLIKDQIASENSLEAGEEDMKAAARDIARMQFAQYGMANVPDEHLDQFVSRMMEKNEDKNNIRSRVIENKVIDHVKSTVKLDEEEISLDKFNKLFEK